MDESDDDFEDLDDDEEVPSDDDVCVSLCLPQPISFLLIAGPFSPGIWVRL
jgi:hypothetical protein